MASIIFQIARNKVLFGNDLEVDAHLVGSEGRIQIQGPNGPVLRPLGFGERNRLVRMVAQSSSIPSELAAVIKQAAVVEPGTAEVPAHALEALALHLSGAGSGAPGFSTQAGILSHQFGWSPKELENQSALEVDSLAAKWMEAHDSAQPDDGWQRIVLQPGPSAKEQANLEGLVEGLAQDLLDRYHEMLNREVFEQSRKQSERNPIAQARDTQFEQAPPSNFQDPGLDFPGQQSRSLEPNTWNTGGDSPDKGSDLSPSATPASQSSEQNSFPSTLPVSSAPYQSNPDDSSSVQPSFKNVPVPTSAASDLNSDALKQTPEQTKPRHPASDSEEINLKKNPSGSPDHSLPKALKDFDWEDLGLNNASSKDFVSEINPSSPPSHSPWREDHPSRPGSNFQSDASANETATQLAFPDTSSGIQQARRQGSGFQLEPLHGAAGKVTGNSRPSSSQDVIQTIADALHKIADLRGIDS